MRTTERPDRLLALDSLRDMAAFSVMLHHFTLIFPAVDKIINNHTAAPDGLVNFLAYTPLHAGWCGYESVVFFFVLSGFVLAIPFLGEQPPSVSHYYVKRVFRIYPPYLCAVAVAILASAIFYRGAIPELSDWFNHQWRSGIDWKLVGKHILFLGSFDTTRFDGPIWSLLIEMRISLIFPLLMLLVRRLDWKTALLVGLLPGLFFWTTTYLKANGLMDIGTIVTFRHVGFFVLGGLLAKHRGALVNYFRNLRRRQRVLLLLASLLAYTNTWWLNQSGLLTRVGLAWLQDKPYLEDVGIAAGVAGLILIGLSSPSIGGVLHSRVLTFLGKISFSLYLYHLICLFVLLNLFYGHLPTPIILLASALLSLAMATAGYYLVELPAMNLGRSLVSRLKPNP